MCRSFIGSLILSFTCMMTMTIPAHAEHYRVTVNWKKINEQQAGGAAKGFSIAIPGGWVVGQPKFDVAQGIEIRRVPTDEAKNITCRIKAITLSEARLEVSSVRGCDIASFEFWTREPLSLPQFFRDPTDGLWSIQQIVDQR
ncbi:MAG: hypothetical protein MPJ50_02310 [Pirellulales bacterium]|nr:hypothetical protein [Pirellulales bacterium]